MEKQVKEMNELFKDMLGVLNDPRRRDLKETHEWVSQLYEFFKEIFGVDDENKDE